MSLRKMLWVEDNAGPMSSVAEGFITYSKQDGFNIDIDHYWMKVGNHYRLLGDYKEELSEDALGVITKVDEQDFGGLTDTFDFRDINYAIEYMCKYDVVAVNLALMKEDTDISRYNRNNPVESLSMKICKLLRVRDDTPKIILYSYFAIDGNLDDLWKDTYRSFHPEDNLMEQFVYARKSLSKNPSTFSEYRALQLIQELSEVR
jgi:hypothetical protein